MFHREVTTTDVAYLTEFIISVSGLCSEELMFFPSLEAHLQHVDTRFKKWEHGVVLYAVFIQHVTKIGHIFKAVGKLCFCSDFIVIFLIGQNWGSDTDKEFECVDIQNKIFIFSF